jgi:uncharacterized protein YjbI with pentapeptide repeats
VCAAADFSGANLTDATVTNASLASCQTVSTRFGQLTVCGAASFSGSDLSGANFTGATLGPTPGACAPNFLNFCGGADFSGTLLVPSDQVVTASGSSGAMVTWSTPPPLPGATPGSCNPSSGSNFPVGTTTVTCQVLDDIGDVATGTFAVVVTKIQTVANVVSSSPNPSSLGKPVTYTASVFTLPNPGAPPATGGTVAFLDNRVPISGCSAVPVSGASRPSAATATCTTTPDAPGAHAITARYSGSGIFAPGSSGSPFAQVVTQHPCQALAGCNLKGLDFSHATLTAAHLQGANLAGADLRGATLDYASLKEANLNGANLGGANLIRATLEGANLRGANLKGVLWGTTTCPDGTNSDKHGGTCLGHL